MTGPITGAATRVRVGPGDDVAALVRAAPAGSVLVLIDPALDAPAAAQACAAIGPLAVERGPDTRVNALLVAADARAEDAEAAARFLEAARSTTGQVLKVGAR